MRIGIVGAGLMGRWHAYAARQARAEIVAIADTDIENARQLASRYNASAHASVDDLIGTSDISLLHICAPTNAHLPLSMMALDHGLHLMVEKPLAACQVDTIAILQKAKSAKKIVCPSHQYAFQRSVGKIINQLDRAGDLIAIDLQFYSAGGVGLDPTSFPLLAADILPHPLSILQRVFPSQDMSEIEWQLSSSRSGDWAIRAHIGDARIQITISLLARPTSASVKLSGTKGSFEADLFHDYVVWSGGEANRTTKILQPFTRSIAHFWSASKNLAFRAVFNEPAYPGLNNLTSKCYSACNEGESVPVCQHQILDIAVMRDRFLKATQSHCCTLEPIITLKSDTS